MTQDILIGAWVLAFCLGGWMTHAVLMLYTTRVVPSIGALAAPPPARWPRLSVIVPACDEADTIVSALTSLLAEDYPDVELIVVDDRSRDGTGDKVDALAARDARVVPIHVRELPAGWLGKVNALEQGMRRARGEWVLLTDADVVFARGTLRRVVAWALHEGRDFVTAVPHVKTTGLLQESTVLALSELTSVAGRIWAVARPHSTAYAGIGPFNLLRREVYDRSPGLPWLAMEVVEDVGVGLLMSEAGARKAILNGRDALEWAWYPSFADMLRGFEKNAFGLFGQYRYWQAVAFVILVVLTVSAPFVALFAPHGMPWARAVGGAALALHVPYALGYSRWLGRSAQAGLAIPLGKLLFAWALARSAWRFWRRGGIVWRGTPYAASALRAGRRVRQSRPLAPVGNARRDVRR